MTTGLGTHSSPALLLQEDAIDSVSHVVVHPLVLLSVLDHHTRRQEADGRVIGTLLGRRDGNKVRAERTIAVLHGGSLISTNLATVCRNSNTVKRTIHTQQKNLARHCIGFCPTLTPATQLPPAYLLTPRNPNHALSLHSAG
jgi:hypothetical protein